MDDKIVTYGQIATKYNYLPTRIILGPVISQRLIEFIANEQ